MIDVIFNSELVETLMLSLYQRHEIYASGLAREEDLTLSAVQKQLTRFEQAGLLASRTVGKTRVYRFNMENPYTKPLMMMLKTARENSSPSARKKTTNDRQHSSQKQPPTEVDEKLWLY